jgi:hypothetical protein
MHAAIAHVHALDDGIAKRSAALDHSLAHTRECRLPVLLVNSVADVAMLKPGRADRR